MVTVIDLEEASLPLPVLLLPLLLQAASVVSVVSVTAAMTAHRSRLRCGCPATGDFL
jgi:hypothetical protein